MQISKDTGLFVVYNEENMIKKIIILPDNFQKKENILCTTVLSMSSTDRLQVTTVAQFHVGLLDFREDCDKEENEE